MIKAATYAAKTGENLNSILKRMSAGGDLNAKRALAGLANKKKQLTDEERVAFNVLGISTNGYGRRAGGTTVDKLAVLYMTFVNI